LRHTFAILTLLFAFQAPVTQATEGNGLTMIGLDENGSEIEFPMKSKRWKKRVSKVLKRVGGEVIPALNNTIQSTEQFKLGQVDIGLYVKMKAEIGDLIKGAVVPYFKLYFKR